MKGALAGPALAPPHDDLRDRLLFVVPARSLIRLSLLFIKASNPASF